MVVAIVVDQNTQKVRKDHLFLIKQNIMMCVFPRNFLFIRQTTIQTLLLLLVD